MPTRSNQQESTEGIVDGKANLTEENGDRQVSNLENGSNSEVEVDMGSIVEVDMEHVEFAVVDDLGTYDMIIGINTMRRYDLTSHFRCHFVTDCGGAAPPEVPTARKDDLSNDRPSLVEETVPKVGDMSATFLRKNSSEIFANSRNPRTPWTRRKSRDELLDIEIDVDGTELLPDPPWEEDKSQFNANAAEPDSERGIPKSLESAPLGLRLRKFVRQFNQIFQTGVGKEPARVTPYKFSVDDEKWKFTDASRRMRRARPQTRLKDEAIKAFIEKSLKAGIIEKCDLPDYSHIHLTKKPNGNWRYCIDFRLLNSATKSAGWPLPNIDAMLRRIGDAKPKHFAVIDLTAGYHQTEIDESCRDYTAFITPHGLYRWKRVPMGLKGAPSYFQHQMQAVVLDGLVGRICEIYIDDIIIYGKTDDEFMDNLTTVFERFEKFNILLNPNKIQLGLSEVEYCGRTLNEEGMSFSKKKRDKVFDFDKPETQSQLKSFLGLTNYFRNHVPMYSVIAQPLEQLTHGYDKRNKRKKVKWTEELNRSFYELQTAVANCPQLYFHDEKSGDEIILETDASDYGIGAYLFQVRYVDGIRWEYPISFISKSLNETERKWATIEKEAFAIFYAFQKFEHLIRDIHFVLRTDHENLTYINVNPKQKVQRWKLAIQHYDFDIEHIAGKDNIIADAFSRFCTKPLPKKVQATSTTTLMDNKPIVIKPKSVPRVRFMISSLNQIGVVNEHQSEPIATSSIETGSLKSIMKQKEHSDVVLIPTILTESEPVSMIEKSDEDFSDKKRSHVLPSENLVVDNDIEGSDEVNYDTDVEFEIDNDIDSLERRLNKNDETQTKRVKSPLSKKTANAIKEEYLSRETRKLISEAHNVTVGHHGVQRTINKLILCGKSWKGMRQDVRCFIDHCPACQKMSRLKRVINVPRFVVTKINPMQRIAVDTVGPFEKDENGYVYVLVITDSFTRWTELIPMRYSISQLSRHSKRLFNS